MAATPSQTMFFSLLGRMMSVSFFIQGTSNATGFTFTVPVACNTNLYYTSFQAQDNGSYNAASGMLNLPGTSTVATLYYAWNGTGWTNSGAKKGHGSLWYFI
jgi:hypothetical protein